MYALMDKLREQALGAGGRVLSHLGNHEVSRIQSKNNINAINDYPSL